MLLSESGIKVLNGDSNIGMRKKRSLGSGGPNALGSRTRGTKNRGDLRASDPCSKFRGKYEQCRCRRNRGGSGGSGGSKGTPCRTLKPTTTTPVTTTPVDLGKHQLGDTLANTKNGLNFIFSYNPLL